MSGYYAHPKWPRKHNPIPGVFEDIDKDAALGLARYVFPRIEQGANELEAIAEWLYTERVYRDRVLGHLAGEVSRRRLIEVLEKPFPLAVAFLKRLTMKLR